MSREQLPLPSVHTPVLHVHPPASLQRLLIGFPITLRGKRGSAVGSAALLLTFRHQCVIFLSD